MFLLFGFVPAIDEDEEEDGAALAATGFVALSEDWGVGGLAVEPSAAEAGFVCFTSMATALSGTRLDAFVIDLAFSRLDPRN